MRILEDLANVPRNVWIVVIVLVLLISFGSYYWGKSNGLEEAK